MTAPTLLLVGAGGHATACIDVIEAGGRFTVIGLVGSPVEVGTKVLGYPVLGTDEDLQDLFVSHPRALVAVGHVKSPDQRIRLFERLQGAGFELPVIVSPLAYVSKHATLGAGTIVMHGAIVNAGASVGRNCIINTHALVEHDAVIGDHCHIATAAVINGGVRVGAGTFFGSNSTARQCIAVGEHCVIGMAQPLLADCDPGVMIPPQKRPT
jgi:sugar O-acyltransferase (sialic acid O-acetyltransferase NeuD family)